MAAVRTMMAVAREEAAIVTSELAVAARTAVVEGAATAAGAERNAVMEAMNPMAVRQAAEASVKTAAEDCSLLTHHLAHAPITGSSSTATALPRSTALTLDALSGVGPSTVSTSMTGSTRTMVTQTLEEDLGTTLKEVMSNAMQTGVEEQMDTVAEVAKALVGESAAGGQVLAEMKQGIQVVA
ncbi:hypothetical protein IAU60_003721 [Kwoniella sp. DSM 27419]